MKPQCVNGQIFKVHVPQVSQICHRQKGFLFELRISLRCFPHHTNIRNNLHSLLDRECKTSWKKSSKIQSCQVYYSGQQYLVSLLMGCLFKPATLLQCPSQNFSVMSLQRQVGYKLVQYQLLSWSYTIHINVFQAGLYCGVKDLYVWPDLPPVLCAIG